MVLRAKWCLFCFILLLPFVCLQPVPETADPPPDSCTSIMVGRLASADGSVMTAHTCDGNYRTWLNIVPAAKNGEGAEDEVFSGKMHTGFADDLRGVELMGSIPAAAETYAFINTAYPAMNEHQLGMGETTFGGRRELRSDEGIFYIEELQRIALQRCKTAREAIRLIGALIKEYGYRDSGECITIIDSREAWQMEILGPGKGNLGGVWAAQRIPDDHVGISANICRIGEIDLKCKDHFMASDNVFKLARKMKWWDAEKEPFKFWKAYGGSRSGKPFSIREYWVLSRLAPSLNLRFDAEELPFSVRPEKKVSLQDLMAFYRATYEGSEYDMTQNLKVLDRRTQKEIISPAVNPWMSRHLRELLNSLRKDAAVRHRPIAVEYCAYHTILQARSWLPAAVGGIVWLGFDNPAMTPKFPIFAGVTTLSDSLRTGSQKKYSRDSAAWAYRRAAKLAMIRWDSCREAIEKAMRGFEEKALFELPHIEAKALDLYREDPAAAREFLTRYSNDFNRAIVDTYWELGDTFWMLYGRGF